MKAILRCIKNSADRNFKVEVEVDAGVGLADVVAYKKRPRTTNELRMLASIPPRLAPLLAPENAKAIKTVDDLAASLGLSMTSAQRVIKTLVQLGLWVNSSPGKPMPAIRIQPFESIVSIEAKLTDWPRALVQAYRNLQFANESWVVLDHKFCKPALIRLDHFERAGVGLASIDGSGDLHLHFRAPSAQPLSPMKRWQAQAALARRVCGTD